MAAIYVRTGGKDTLFTVVNDRQNSLTAVMDVATGKVEKFAYEPWGMRRNPSNMSFEMGSINGKSGIYTVGINKDGIIYHRCFYEYETFF